MRKLLWDKLKDYKLPLLPPCLTVRSSCPLKWDFLSSGFDISTGMCLPMSEFPTSNTTIWRCRELALKNKTRQLYIYISLVPNHFSIVCLFIQSFCLWPFQVFTWSLGVLCKSVSTAMFLFLHSVETVSIGCRLSSFTYKQGKANICIEHHSYTS